MCEKMASKEDLKNITSKDDFKKLKSEILNEIKHFSNLCPCKENKDNNIDLSQPHIDKIEKHMENNMFESLIIDNPHNHGFNSGPRNYFIHNSELRKFD